MVRRGTMLLTVGDFAILHASLLSVVCLNQSIICCGFDVGCIMHCKLQLEPEH